MGEAPARSSLVPRDLTAELCLIALASLGHLSCADTHCSVFESACSYLCPSLRSEFCCWEYALRRSLLVVVRQLSVPCIFLLCLV